MREEIRTWVLSVVTDNTIEQRFPPREQSRNSLYEGKNSFFCLKLLFFFCEDNPYHSHLFILYPTICDLLVI